MSLTNIPMNYAHPSTKVAHLRRNADGNDGETDLVLEPVNVSVRNARDDKQQPTLHKHGVELVADDLNVALFASNKDSSSNSNSNSNSNSINNKPIDFLDNNDVMDRYYPLCEALLQKKLMMASSSTSSQKKPVAVSVRAFDHNIRIAGSNNEEIKNGAGSRVQFPLPLVHGDYTHISAPRRIQDLARPPKINDVWRVRLKDGESLLNDAQMVQEATALQGKRRFALVNVWRSIDPVRAVSCYPLACIDATTLSATQDLRTYQVHYADRIGENFVCLAHPLHEWIYFDQMTMDEVMLIKQWDSHGDFARCLADTDDASATTSSPSSSRGEPNCCTLSVHSACDWHPPNTPPRKSIEVRCVCIWDADEESIQ
jgi:hypothetical protein